MVVVAGERVEMAERKNTGVTGILTRIFGVSQPVAEGTLWWPTPATTRSAHPTSSTHRQGASAHSAEDAALVSLQQRVQRQEEVERWREQQLSQAEQGTSSLSVADGDVDDAGVSEWTSPALLPIPQASPSASQQQAVGRTASTTRPAGSACNGGSPCTSDTSMPCTRAGPGPVAEGQETLDAMAAQLRGLNASAAADGSGATFSATSALFAGPVSDIVSVGLPAHAAGILAQSMSSKGLAAISGAGAPSLPSSFRFSESMGGPTVARVTSMLRAPNMPEPVQPLAAGAVAVSTTSRGQPVLQRVSSVNSGEAGGRLWLLGVSLMMLAVQTLPVQYIVSMVVGMSGSCCFQVQLASHTSRMTTEIVVWYGSTACVMRFWYTVTNISDGFDCSLPRDQKSDAWRRRWRTVNQHA